MEDQEPLLRVVRGTPTAEELAALVGVVLTRLRPVAPPAQVGPSPWVRSGRPDGVVGRQGVGAWRRSGLPR